MKDHTEESNFEMVSSQKQDENTKKVRRRIEDHMRKNFTKEQVYGLALLLGINTVLQPNTDNKYEM